MNFTEIIKSQIDASINTKLAVKQQLSETIATAGIMLADCLKNGHKVLCCGNGGSASDAQHFSAELLGRYVRERVSLPAISLNSDTSTLTAVANDYGYDQVFARQISGLGQKGDVLFAITTSGNSENIICAVQAAEQRDMRVIVLTGKGGGKISGLLNKDSVNICIPDDVTSRIQEAHIMIIHCLCEIIDMKI